MTTLVTGATGCLGSSLARALVARGERVVALKPHAEPLGPLAALRGHIDVLHGDVRRIEDVRAAMRGVDRVYHVAGVAAQVDRLATLMWEVNVAGTHNVAAAALEAGVARMVHVSSSAAIGYPPEGVVADEDFPAVCSVTDTAYAMTKRRSEQAVQALVHAGLDAVIVNPAAVLAPGASPTQGWGGIVDAVASRRLRTHPRGGTGVCTRETLVAGMLAAMDSGRAGRRYILCSANLDYREMFAIIAAEAGVRAPARRIPAPALRTLGRMVDAWGALRPQSQLAAGFGRATADLALRRLYYDGGRARRELGVPDGDVRAAIAEMLTGPVGEEGIRDRAA